MPNKPSTCPSRHTSLLLAVLPLGAMACLSSDPMADLDAAEDKAYDAGALYHVVVNVGDEDATPRTTMSTIFEVNPEADEETYTAQLEDFEDNCPPSFRSEGEPGVCKLRNLYYFHEATETSTETLLVPYEYNIGSATVEWYARGDYRVRFPYDLNPDVPEDTSIHAETIFTPAYGHHWETALEGASEVPDFVGEIGAPSDFLLTRSQAGRLTLRNLEGKTIRRSPAITYQDPGFVYTAQAHLQSDSEIIVRGWHEEGTKRVYVYDLMISMTALLDAQAND